VERIDFVRAFFGAHFPEQNGSRELVGCLLPAFHIESQLDKRRAKQRQFLIARHLCVVRGVRDRERVGQGMHPRRRAPVPWPGCAASMKVRLTTRLHVALASGPPKRQRRLTAWWWSWPRFWARGLGAPATPQTSGGVAARN